MMLGLIPSLVIGAAVFIGTFVSGIFGMVGGQIVLAVALYYMPVAAAMTMFSALMFTSGLWRGFMWRQHVDWAITIRYVAGSVVAYVLMLFIQYVPTKPIVYLGLGLTPLMADLVPKRFSPRIDRAGMPYFAGFLVMVLQILVGVGGNVLDAFFQKSALTRHTIVATKAVTQLFSQAGRFFYFGLAALDAGETAPWQLMIIYIGLTIAGGSAAGSILNRMSDAHFRRWTRVLIWILSLIYVARGLWLIAIGSTT
jgi:uncharacterized membrane protein YfcA